MLRVAFACACAAAAAAALPAGFATFFSSSCPDGWSTVTDAQGRLVVSVADGSVSGTTVGTPLGNLEDRVHTHAYAGVIAMPEHHVAAIDCCNDDGAGNGEYPVSGTSNPATSGLPFIQTQLCVLLNDSDNYTVPFGTVAYFLGTGVNGTSCPASWSVYTEATGRAMVPQNIPLGSNPVVSVDAPLSNGEDRAHQHSVSASVDVADVEYVGVDGCCNDNPTNSGAIPFDASMTPGSSGLPYIQMLTCFSSESSFTTVLPDTALYFNPIFNCQNGWVLATPFAGRFLVVLPDGGTPNAEFGGAVLGPNDTSCAGTQHTFAGSISLPSTGVGLASGCCADGYGKAGQTWYAGTSDTVTTGFPFIQVPMCMAANMTRVQ